MLLLSLNSIAQEHMHHQAQEKKDTSKTAGEMDMNMDMGNMSHSYSLHLPMNRNGSGTGWLPDASPVYGMMWHSEKWMYMLHGNVFLRYTSQDMGKKGNRGGNKFDAPNWFMLMAQRKVGKNGLFHYEAMISLDRLTEGGAGYPLLFQTGESWKGQPLVDKQHPHDLFTGLSMGYTQALSQKADVFVYVGYPGEPALGSVTFMHRPSSLNGPDAPLGHHWNDATHITFGVATIGFRYGNLKIEGSSFTGREPDENRYDFDKPRFDSWSTRLSYNPSANWALQVSHGFIKSPEVLHAGEDINRTTASAVASYPLGNDKFFNATALWGLNKVKEHEGENTVLAEASLALKRTSVYARYEWVQKSTEELDLNPVVYGKTLFPVNAFIAGAGYDILRVKPVNIAIGGQLSFYKTPSALVSLYGRNPISGEVFLRIYPAMMKM